LTDIEKIEEAIRHVLNHIKHQPWETGVEAVLKMLADEIAKRRMESSA